MNGRNLFRILLVLVLLAVIAVAGIYVYNIGLAQGRIQAAQLANPGNGTTPYLPYWYGPFFHPFGFGFGLFGFFFLLFLAFIVTRLLFWRTWRGWGRRFPSEDRLEEWHRQQHDQG
jgi:hypothetical protein